MTKTNKKSIVALVVMAFLLVASIVLGATGAWFTSSATPDADEIGFGKIEITLPDYELTAERSVANTGDLPVVLTEIMPGDELKFAGTITNTNNKAWVAVEVTIEISLADSEATAENADLFDSLEGYTITCAENKYTAVKTTVVALEKNGTITLATSFDTSFDTDIKDKLELATGTVTLRAAAIQHANYVEAGETPTAAQIFEDVLGA